MTRHLAVRVGEQPSRREEVSYWCVHGHRTSRRWSAGIAVPERWECRCGLPAGRDRADPPAPRAWQPYKTPLAYLLERRSEAECEALLAEALQSLRARRADGDRLRRTRGPRP